MKILGINLSPEPNFAVYEDGQIGEVLEATKFCSKKNVWGDEIALDKCWTYIKRYWGTDFDKVAFAKQTQSNSVAEIYFVLRDIGIKGDFVPVEHHTAHACVAKHTCHFGNPMVLSMDGSPDVATVVNPGRPDQVIVDVDYGNMYNDVALELGLERDGVDAAGKLMGWAAYGNYNSQYLVQVERWIDGDRFVLPKVYDWATTFQEEWIKSIIALVKEHYTEDNDGLCLVGGCALNGLLVRRLQEEGYTTYVPPCPGDSGLSLGAILYALSDSVHSETWDGINPYLCPKLDYNSHKFTVYEEVTAEKVARLLAEGNIVGNVRGHSEIGPRALGNRSIFADPRNENIKDILNERVKNREPYRPFAPIVTEEDAHKYFDLKQPSPYMNIVCNVLDDGLKGITHVDGTARVQTVNKNQNSWVYSLLKEFEKLTGYPVLVNTSLNLRGQPTLNDDFLIMDMLKEKRLDALVISSFLVKE